jgi:hypothetical protein
MKIMSYLSLLVLAVVIWFGYKFIKAKGAKGGGHGVEFPSGFSPTHSHDNIALNADTKKLWVREESGATKVFEPSEITGWGVSSETTHNKHGATWPAKVYLEIKTKDIDRPLWRVRFKRYGELMPEKRNLNECNEWYERLGAAYNH